VHGNDFRDDAVVIEVDGGGDALAVDFLGNHFSDYEGYDLNGDGIGDVAYEVKALSSELTESRPSLKFVHGTAAMGVVDAVAHAVPVLAARKLLVDPKPLVRFPEVKSP
jgi:nitrous oxidase accessory protein